MLHRGHRTWTPYVDPHPDKENGVLGLPLKTPVRHAAGSSRHQTGNGKAAMTGGKVGVSQTVKGKEKEGGVEGKRAPMTVFKDRNLVLTGKKNGVSERGGQDGENDTFGIKKLDFKPAGSSTASIKPKSKLSQQVSSIPSPADDGFSALPLQTPFFVAQQQRRTSLGGVDSTPLPSATRSRRRSSNKHSGTPLGPSPESLQLRGLTSTPAPSGNASARFPSSNSLSNLVAPTPLDKSFITPARPSYRAYVSPPGYELEGDEDISGRGDESFEMGDVRARMGGLGVVDEGDGEVGVDGEVEMAQMDAMVESDGEVEYMPPKVVALEDVIPFDFVPLKTLGQQLRQITSDFCIADDDSDEEAYTHVERRWNLDLGKEELLVGGWEGDDDVKPVGTKARGLKRLELRPDTEFHNPIFAALKINQPKVAANKRPVVSSLAQTRRPMAPTVRRPVSGPQPKVPSNIASGRQRPSTLTRRPVTSTASKPTQASVSPAPTAAPTRRERLPISSATTRAPVTRPAFGDGKGATPRSTTVRPALGQVRANAKPAPVKEVLLKCEDIGFDL